MEWSATILMFATLNWSLARLARLVRLVRLVRLAHRGKGRCPWCTEPGAVVLITDGKNAFMDFSTSGSVDGSEAFTTDDEGDDDGDEIGSQAKRNGGSLHGGEGRTRRMPLTMDAVGIAAASSAVGSELCGKPFRWDQRLFTLLIRSGDGGKGIDGEGGDPDIMSPDFDEAAIMALKVRGELAARQARLVTWHSDVC